MRICNLLVGAYLSPSWFLPRPFGSLTTRFMYEDILQNVETAVHCRKQASGPVGKFCMMRESGVGVFSRVKVGSTCL